MSSAGITFKDLFWLLPYDTRRNLYPIIKPDAYRNLEKLSINELGSATVKPFHEYKCVFVHIPKTAGLSVAYTLFGDYCTAHLAVRDYQIVLTRSEFNQYFKFTFVRNPWDRLYSAYTFLKRGGLHGDDSEWPIRNLTSIGNFEDFVTHKLDVNFIYADFHFTPQFEFLRSRGRQPAVDFVGRFERMEEDFYKICKILKVTRQLMKMNVSQDREKDYRNVYSRKMVQKVEKLYRRDIDIFSYKF